MYYSLPELTKLAYKVTGENKRRVNVQSSLRVNITNNYWSDGYKHTYYLHQLGGETVRIEDINPLRGVPENHLDMRPGFVLFCKVNSGCAVYIYIYVHPDNMPQNLTQEVELTDDEKLVLYNTRCLKASYGGIPNYRYHQARHKITLDNWNKAKNTLVDKGLLDKRGALTTQGRNVASNIKDLSYSN